MNFYHFRFTGQSATRPATISRDYKHGFIAAASLLVLALCAPSGLKAEITPETAPPDLAGWSLHCFCISAVRSPHQAIRADNNGEILFRARDGISRTELEAAGVQVTDSQLMLMQMFDVLDVDGDSLRTTIPVVGPERLFELRSRLRLIAGDIISDLEPHIHQITEYLVKNDMAQSQYTVVFAHAVDGVLWGRLRDQNLLPETELDREHPLWRGAFWALFPRRGNVAGTNEIDIENGHLVIMWTEPTARKLRELVDAPRFRAAVNRIVDGPGYEQTADPSEEFSNIPVIRQRADDPLHAASSDIADILAAALTQDSRVQAQLASIESADPKEAMVIVAHELIWEVMDALVSRGLVERPAVMDQTDADSDALASMLLIRVSSVQ